MGMWTAVACLELKDTMRDRTVGAICNLLPAWERPSFPDGVVGEQLELELFVNEPWKGRSPRALTRGHLGIILKPQGVRARVLFCDREQLELFPLVGRSARITRRAASPSAPTLLPLPRRHDG